MKLKVSYRKMSSGMIEATVFVDDCEDYPSTCIFENSIDYPTKEGFVLKTKNQFSIEKKCASPEEAVAWAEKQISAIRSHIQRWRAIPVPETVTYTV